MIRTPPEDIFNAIERDVSADEIALRVGRLLDDSLPEGENFPTRQIHPLGFFALTWTIDQSRALRVHYWSNEFDWEQSKDLQIHDHVFAFTSAVLLGSLCNETYSVEPNDKGSALFSTVYTPEGSRLERLPIRVSPVLGSSHVYSRGASYRVERGVLHRTSLLSNEGLTVLAARYNPDCRDGARVIGSSEDDTPTFKRVPPSQQVLGDLMQALRGAVRSASTV